MGGLGFPKHCPKTATVVLIHYGGGKKKYDGVVKQYGRVSETPCFPGENAQEISTDSEFHPATKGGRQKGIGNKR